MDYGQLRKWLGLPPGPWPPDDRELLGLPPGPLDAAAVELRALEQMDRLRPHQLRHPELITEGMNRLAQAMIALSDIGATPVPAPAPKPRRQPKKKPKNPDALPESLALSDPEVVVVEPAAVEPAGPVILDAELVDGPPQEQPAPVSIDPGEPVPIPEPPPPGTAYVPLDRRLAYKELVALRRLIRTWDRLRPTLAVPGEPFLSPVKVLLLLDAADEFRTSALGPFPEHVGNRVAAILLHPLPMGLVRTLVPSQRLAVAKDWALTAAELRHRYDTIRYGLRRSVPRRGMNRWVRSSRRWLRSNPEWLLFVAVLLLIFLGWARSRSS
jgi:hypothetical protein